MLPSHDVAKMSIAQLGETGSILQYYGSILSSMRLKDMSGFRYMSVPASRHEIYQSALTIYDILNFYQGMYLHGLEEKKLKRMLNKLN